MTKKFVNTFAPIDPNLPHSLVDGNQGFILRVIIRIRKAGVTRFTLIFKHRVQGILGSYKLGGIDKGGKKSPTLEEGTQPVMKGN